VQLDAGLQVIKLQAVDAHLNLAYVQFSLVEPDGGVNDGSGAGGTSAAAGGGSGAGGNAGGSGAPTASGGSTAGSSSSDTGGSPGSAGAASSAAGSGGSAPTAASASANNESSCAVIMPGQRSREHGFALALFAAAFVALRRARRSVQGKSI